MLKQTSEARLWVIGTRDRQDHPLNPATQNSVSERSDCGARMAAASSPHRRVYRFIVYALLGAGLLAVASLNAKAAGFSLNNARGVVIPIYATGYDGAVAAMRLDRVAQEQRRLGFFRIRALPVLVIYQARLEVRQTAAASQAISNFCEHLKQLGQRDAVEVRGFQLTLPAEKAPRLEARHVSLQTENKVTGLRLEDVILRGAGPERKLHRAWFGSSPQGPLLRWGNTDAAASCDPFAAPSQDSQNPSPNKSL